jgi:hypothetical protein
METINQLKRQIEVAPNEEVRRALYVALGEAFNEARRAVRK